MIFCPGQSRTIGVVLGAVLLAAASTPSDVLAQEQRQRRNGRIANHRFMESDLVPLPMPTTNINTVVGTGEASDIEVRVFENLDSISTRNIKGDLTYLTFRVNYQQAVNDWLGSWLGLGVTARLGTNSVTLLNEGLAYQFSFELGWLVRIHQWERSSLAATASLWNSNWGFVDVGQWAREAFVDGEIEEGNEIYRSSLSLSGGGGLRYAYAINSTLGAALVLEGGAGEPPDRKSDARGYFRGSVLADVDLNPARHIPIGFALGYRFDSFPGVDPVTKWESSLGIFRLEYTGRDDYAVAIESQVGTLPISSGRTTQVTQIKVTTRYYF